LNALRASWAIVRSFDGARAAFSKLGHSHPRGR
jgi:hypothetical protein